MSRAGFATSRRRRAAGLASIAFVLQLFAARAVIAEATPAGLFEAVSGSIVRIYSRELVVQGVESIDQSIVSTQGSGVVVTPDGKVLTSAHVVQSADEIFIVYADGHAVGARVYASEPAADIAILAPRKPVPPRQAIRLADSSRVRIGDRVTMIGHPLNFEATITVGHLSGRSDRLVAAAKPMGTIEGLEVFRTDAQIFEGASGAPVFDDDGRIVGIASAVIRHRGPGTGIAFAIASNTVRRLLIERRSMWTGISGHWLGGWYARALNLPQAAGLLVERIAAGSPAALLKLRGGTGRSEINAQELLLGGDVILEVQGISLADDDGYEQVGARLAALNAGDPVRVKVLRGGRVIGLETVLSDEVR